jgi:hypothetical protein
LRLIAVLLEKADFILTPGQKGKHYHNENETYPSAQKVISKDELCDIKGNISFCKENLLIEYLGDLYFYRKKGVGENAYYEHANTITFD